MLGHLQHRSDCKKSSERKSVAYRKTEASSLMSTSEAHFVPGKRKLSDGLGVKSVQPHADGGLIADEDERADATAENGELEADDLDAHAPKKARQTRTSEPGEDTASTALSDVRLLSSPSSSSEQGQASSTIIVPVSEPAASQNEKSGFSESSSSGMMPSDPEMGSLVTFSDPWLATQQRREQSDFNRLQGLSTSEIRRRYSVFEYQPLSPFAKYRRRSTILSEGSAPLLLQIEPKWTGPVRQLTVDLGEEWEAVYCPALHNPASHGGNENDADDVFLGPGPPTGDSLPVTGRRASGCSIMSRKHLLRRTSHQTSEQLRVLFPRPVASQLAASARPENSAGPEPVRSAQLGPEGHHSPGLPSSPEQTTIQTVETDEPRVSWSPHPEEIATPVMTTMQPAAGEGNNTQPARAEHVAIGLDAETETMPDAASHERHHLPNPCDRFNQRFHSTIHCPCFFFFCLLCCLPAVYYMDRSYREFNFASLRKARRYSRTATALFVLGGALGLTLFVTCFAFVLPRMFMGPSS